MRILYCIPSFAGGGAERRIMRIAAGLVQAGHEVHVAYQSEGPYHSMAMVAGVQCHQLRGGRHDPRVVVELARLIRKIQPDIVQGWLMQMDIFGALAAKFRGVPFVITEASSELAYVNGRRSVIRQWLTLNLADAVIANSQGGCDYWLGKGLPSKKCIVIPGSAPPMSEIDAVPRVDPSEYGLDGYRIVLAAGRFHSDKNIDNLMAALKIALEEASVAAVMCGEGPLLERVRKDTKGEKRILLRGFVTNVFGWMKTAAVFVSVSRFEGRPNAVIEAMAAGCPVVVSNIPAHREILDEESAIFVDADDPKSIAEGLARAIGDSEASSRRAARAKKSAIGWTSETMVARYEATYVALLASAAVRR